MINLLLLLVQLLLPAVPAAPAGATVEDEVPAVAHLYSACGLEGELEPAVFERGYSRMLDLKLQARMLAVADMSQPSTSKRLYLIDLEARKLVMRTYVAHGSNSGELYATSFSNILNSHQTSLGLYRVGEPIVSPKHGPALLLHGLDNGINCRALEREIIVHGADYVSETFITAHGRLGRSWGCPAVPRADMEQVSALLANGGLLYVHG
jgi:hypothetical protein